MPNAQHTTDNYGPCSELKNLVLVSPGSGVLTIELMDEDGITVSVPVDLNVLTSAKHVLTLLATAGIAWSPDFFGMIGIKVVTGDVYYNYGGAVTDTLNADGTHTYTAVITNSPTSSSRSVPVGNYAAEGWYLFGRAAGN